MVNLSKSRVIAVILFFVVVLHSGHALQTILPSAGYVIYIPAMLAMIYFCKHVSMQRSTNSQDIALVLFCLMFIFRMIGDMGSLGSFYINLICLVMGAYLISNLYSFRDVIKCYLKVMTVISAIAFVGYILVNNTTILNILPRMVNRNGVEYGVAIVYNYIPRITERNCGMFWEPGLFATHLTLALVFEMLIKEKASLFRLGLFSVCIFTANSSAGFALWALCVLLFFVRKQSKELKPLQMILSLILVSVAIIIILNFDDILLSTSLGDNEYLRKLESSALMDSSRILAIIENFKTFLSNPIFGAGYSGALKSVGHIDCGDTTTSLFMMSVFGICGAAYTGLIVWGIMKKRNINFLAKMVLISIALVIVNKEPHMQNYWTWIVLFYLIKSEQTMNSKQPTEEMNVCQG